ncbi:ferritin-like domain-containing protein [Thermobifida halotolerans]|uniref:Ferritin-like domain-containing protein n=1 Tax=Thermobifida halotolerans TaxID=483545 RepID=A0A399G7B1_9ACTN|nr:ferritin-like domain-containing protein [Thermobifida halotolerans]UOE20635.1 ferritin-like domain-containing protein [Thermobifida halotolerans]
MRLENPRDLFVYNLSSIYTGEKKIVEMLDEVSGKVNDSTLSQMLRHHREETQQQIQNLDQCFQAIGESPQQVPCPVVDAIHQEFRQFADMNPSPQVLTMFALAGADKTEHFEIAAYRGLVNKAMLMGETTCIQLLETNLLQEEETAGKLERFANELGRKALAAT